MNGVQWEYADDRSVQKLLKPLRKCDKVESGGGGERASFCYHHWCTANKSGGLSSLAETD